MTEKAQALVVQEIVNELARRLEDRPSKREAEAVRLAVQLMADWFWLDDTRPTNGPLAE